MAKKKDVLSVRLKDEDQWIVKELEKRVRSKGQRATLSGVLLDHLYTTLKQRRLRYGGLQ